MKRLLAQVLGLLLGAGLLLGLFSAERVWRPSHTAAYGMMVSSASNEATPEEVRLLQTIVASVARLQGDQRPVQVNGAFGSGHINVALVPFRSAQESLALPKEGFVSLPPNVLAVDLGAFRSILLHAFNDAVSFVQSLAESERLFKEKATEDKVNDVSGTYGAISLQLRLANFSAGSAAEKYAPMMATSLRTFEAHRDFHLAFVFPIAHELYHLRPNARVGLDVLAEELAADRAALSVAARALEANRDDGNALRYELLLLGIRYYQDRLLQEVFQDMRGLQAQSFLVALLHAPCKEALAVPWPRRFNNPDVVVMGSPLPSPVLSQEEVQQVISRLDTFSRRDHPHLLHRIDRLRKVIAEEPRLHGAMGGFEFTDQLLKLFTHREAYREMFEWTGEGIAGPKPVADIVSRLRLAKENVAAKGCEEERCLTSKAGPGYVDILAERGFIRGMVVAQPMTDPYGASAMLAAVEEFAGQERASQIMLPIGASLKECRLATRMAQLGDYVMSIRTMNEAGWLEARFFALPKSKH